MQRRRSRGFNLTELMVVLVLIAGTLAMAAPAMGDWLIKSRQHNLAKALSNAITLARTEAIKRNTRVTICISADQQTCTERGSKDDQISGWEQGWIIYPGDSLDVNEAIIHHESAGTFSRLTANSTAKGGTLSVRSYISFLSNGRPKQLPGGGFQAGTIAVCAPKQNAINVVMAATGRVRIEKTSTRCP